MRPWPPNRSALKTPSRMSYFNGQSLWGFTIPLGVEAFNWTKLLLDRDANPVQFDDSELQMAMRSGILQLPKHMEAVSVVSDFLRHVHRYLSDHLSALAHFPTDFWFTVPAAWSKNARTLMGQAVANAGFGLRQQDRVFMMSEPEAAAFAVIGSPGNDLKVSWWPWMILLYSTNCRLFSVVMDYWSVTVEEARW